MKKTIVFLLLLCSGFTLLAQDKENKHEQIKALKTAFITSELALTSQESEKFWPIYNNFEEKQNNLRQQKMKFYSEKSADFDKISEKEASSLLSQIQAIEDEIHQNRKKLIADLKSTISTVKIIKLKKAEENFNKKLLKQYKGGKK